MRQHQRHKQHMAYRIPNIHKFYKNKGVIALAIALAIAVTTPFAAGQLGTNHFFADASVADQVQLPDLMLKKVSLENGMLTVDVQNKSTTDIADDTPGATYIYIDNVLAWQYNWSTLSDKSFLQANGEAVIQPQMLAGAHKVGACVDATNVVKEFNEDNNCTYVMVGTNTKN